MSKRIEYYIKIKDGKMSFEGKEKEAFKQDISMYPDGLAMLTVEPIYKKRSGRQNNYYWGVIVPEFQKGTGDMWGVRAFKDEAHDYLKKKFIEGRDETNRFTGEVIHFDPITKDLSTVEAEFYFKQCREFILEFFNREVPEPNEIPDLTDKDKPFRI